MSRAEDMFKYRLYIESRLNLLLCESVLAFEVADYKIEVIVLEPNTMHSTYITTIRMTYGRAQITETIYDYFNPKTNAVMIDNFCRRAILSLFDCIDDWKAIDLEQLE